MHSWILMLCLASKPERCIEYAARPTYTDCHVLADLMDIRYPTLFSACQRRTKDLQAKR